MKATFNKTLTYSEYSLCCGLFVTSLSDSLSTKCLYICCWNASWSRKIRIKLKWRSQNYGILHEASVKMDECNHESV